MHGKQRQKTRMYSAVEMCGNEYSLNETIGRDVRTHKFRHLHLHHFVRLPHHYHSLENSRTFQDLALKFPGLSRTKPIFQDFPGPGNCTQKIQDFPGAWEPWAVNPKTKPTNTSSLYVGCYDLHPTTTKPTGQALAHLTQLLMTER